MIKTKEKCILEGLQKIKGIGDFQLIANTTQVANKKSRVTKIKTPDHLVEITKVAFVTVSLGDNYTDAVKSQRKAEGLSTDFKAQATYCTPLNQIRTDLISRALKMLGVYLTEKSSEVIYKHNTKNQFYLRVYPSLAREYQVTHVFFDAHGNEIPLEDWPQIQAEYFKLPTKNKNQGLEKDIIVNNYKIENVLYLADKDSCHIINELNEEHLEIVGLSEAA